MAKARYPIPSLSPFQTTLMYWRAMDPQLPNLTQSQLNALRCHRQQKEYRRRYIRLPKAGARLESRAIRLSKGQERFRKKHLQAFIGAYHQFHNDIQKQLVTLHWSDLDGLSRKLKKSELKLIDRLRYTFLETGYVRTTLSGPYGSVELSTKQVLARCQALKRAKGPPFRQIDATDEANLKTLVDTIGEQYLQKYEKALSRRLLPSLDDLKSLHSDFQNFLNHRSGSPKLLSWEGLKRAIDRALSIKFPKGKGGRPTSELKDARRDTLHLIREIVLFLSTS